MGNRAKLGAAKRRYTRLPLFLFRTGERDARDRDSSRERSGHGDQARMVDAMPTIIDEWIKEAALFSSRLGASVLILFGFYLASVLAKRIICRIGRTSDAAKQDVLNLIGQIAKIGLLTFGVVTALGTLGVNVSTLVAGLGLTGFAWLRLPRRALEPARRDSYPHVPPLSPGRPYCRSGS